MLVKVVVLAVMMVVVSSSSRSTSSSVSHKNHVITDYLMTEENAPEGIPSGSLIAQLVKNPPAMQETQFNSWVRKICWRRERLPTPIFLGFPLWLVKNPPVMWETWLRSLGWENPLEKGKATHSSIVAWRMSNTNEQLSLSVFSGSLV